MLLENVIKWWGLCGWGVVLTSGDFPEHFGGHEILKPLGVVAWSVYGDTVL